MNDFKPETSRIDTVAARLELPGQKCYVAYVGLDVHKETIAVAVAEPGRQEPRSEGEIANRPKSVEKLVRRLSERFGGGVLQFVHEAEPCGYSLYHQLAGTGHICEVVAPSRIPKAPAERIKTDRRDALKLAAMVLLAECSALTFVRNGQLTGCLNQHVPISITKYSSAMEDRERQTGALYGRRIHTTASVRFKSESGR